MWSLIGCIHQVTVGPYVSEFFIKGYIGQFVLIITPEKMGMR